jgi:hypothetical protein
MALDSGKQVQPLTANVQNIILQYKSLIIEYANAARVPPIFIAGPMARKINETDVGDYKKT